MATIISVSGQKGGCGKSTTTIILASMLAYKYGKKVLVIDADTNQHSISKSRLYDIQLIQPHETEEKDENGEPLKDENGKTIMVVDNWDIYEAFKKQKKQPYLIIDSKLDYDEIRNTVESQGDNYDYILLDLPGNLDSKNYFKSISLADVIFIPFIVDPIDFDSNYPFAKLLHDQILNNDKTNVKQLYYFWTKVIPDTRKSMFDNMREIIAKEMPSIVELENKISQSSATTNPRCRNTMVAPLGKFALYGNIGVTVEEMCQKIFFDCPVTRKK